MESHVLGVNKGIESYIAPWAVDVTNPLSQHMVERGEANKRVYDEFVSDLANRKSTYYSVTDIAGAATPSEIHLLFGDRHCRSDDTLAARKHDMRYQAQATVGRGLSPKTHQEEAPQKCPIGGTGRAAGFTRTVATLDKGEEDDTEQAGTTVAAFTNKPASIPGRNGTPFISKYRAPERATKSATIRRRDAPDRRENRGYRKTASDDQQEELPEPDDNQGHHAGTPKTQCVSSTPGVFHATTTREQRSADSLTMTQKYHTAPTSCRRIRAIPYSRSQTSRVQLEMTRAYSGQQEADS